jgi:alkylation response protein AidB-like acyl-CoA dehydrogenase
MHITADADTRAKYQGIIDFLIPIAKGYVTDRCLEVCNQGIQVYGGYGYIREYPMEQLLRDCRITPIYEGTNGIQAMDLLGRKLGAPLRLFELRTRDEELPAEFVAWRNKRFADEDQ